MQKKYKKESADNNPIKNRIVEGLTITIVLFLIIKHYNVLEIVPAYYQDEVTDYFIGFCPGCKTEFLTILNQSKEVKCAFYSLNDPDVIKVLYSKNGEVKVFHSNFKSMLDLVKNLNESNTTVKYIPVYSYGLMHHKFCILDNRYIILGSLNPTQTGFEQSNDFLVIPSERLVKELNKEYLYLGNTFYRQDYVNKLIALLYFKRKELLICRKDLCKERLMYEISNAKDRIWFAQFLITDNDVAELLIEKSQTLDVKGIINKENINLKGSDYYKIKNFTKPCKDIHLKIWIIDNKTITGSLNPSENGFTKNDELMFIIKNKEAVNEYTSQFIELFNKIC